MRRKNVVHDGVCLIRMVAVITMLIIILIKNVVHDGVCLIRMVVVITMLIIILIIVKQMVKNRPEKRSCRCHRDPIVKLTEQE